MKALSIRQPWAWMILHAGKDVENRTWPTDYRGWVAIHAAAGCTHDEFEDAMMWVGTILRPDERLPTEAYRMTFDTLQRGCIVGAAVLHDCVSHQHRSRWFQGPYGFLLRDVLVLEKPIPMKGHLGLWECPELGQTPADTPAFGLPF